ncbi:MAG TPA: hypothetical protein VMF64_14675 [Steroidobacteraceae bacterium]|nr:hypothetical protein [Steroidobacteraceae bacterium]
MNELTLNPGLETLPAGEKQIVLPVLAAPSVRRRSEIRQRRRFSARVLQTSDGGFRPFRIY